MFDLLGTMEAGGKAIEVNRALRSVQDYIQRYRASDICEGLDVQFVARRGRVGWTRIWRVK
jgi:hypothetical protein